MNNNSLAALIFAVSLELYHASYLVTCHLCLHRMLIDDDYNDDDLGNGSWFLCRICILMRFDNLLVTLDPSVE